MQTRAELSFKQKQRSVKYRKAVIDFYGGKCARCGFSDIRALQIDHIFGDGAKERKRGKYVISNPGTRYLRVLQNPERYQLLCANCNWIKRYENKEDGSRREERAA